MRARKDWRQSLVRVMLRRAAARWLPPAKANGLRVLAYHRVRPDADDPRSVTPALFRSHLTTLRDGGWRVVSLSTVLAHLNGNAPLPPKAVLLTFDDGYADLYEWAAPLLSEFQMPACIFMLARYVGKRGQTYSEAHYPEAPFLTAAQLRDLHRAGIEIGSHGLWHVPLALLTLKEAWKEVSLSKQLLSDLLGDEVRAFSYPWGRAGDFGQEHVTMVERAGYAAAFTMLHGVNLPPLQRFLLRRCHVYPFDDPVTFRAILEGRFDGWCLKNLPVRQWLRRLRKSPTHGTKVGKS